MVRLALLAVLTGGCAYLEKDQEPEGPGWDHAVRKGRTYLLQILDFYEEVDRCDSLTFAGHWNCAVPEDRRVDLEKHEYTMDGDRKISETGQMNRHTKPCYGVDLNGDGRPDSRSGISAEGIIGTGVSSTCTGNGALVSRVLAYGDLNDWVMGDGPTEYTKLWFLAPLMYETGAILDEESKPASKNEDAIVDYWPQIKGYRGNVIGYHIDWHRRVHGKILVHHREALDALVESVPDSPIYQALSSRFEGGSDSDLMALLNDDERFPPDRCPEDSDNLFSWGEGSPACVLYLYTLSIARDRWWDTTQ